MTVATTTTTVVPTTSLRFGQVTFFISEVVSRQKSFVAMTHSFGFATIAFPFSSIFSYPRKSSPLAALGSQAHHPDILRPGRVGPRAESRQLRADVAGQEGLEPTTCGF